MPGRAFEEAVASVQRLLDPGSQVSHDERLLDRGGNPRQFDVVIRGKSGGQPILGVVECKDEGRPVSITEVDAFESKRRDVNANLAIIASRKGFSKGALDKATKSGIGAISLLAKSPTGRGFRIRGRVIAEIYRWQRIEVQPRFVKEGLSVAGLDIRQVCYGSTRVVDWFMRELATTYSEVTKAGWMPVEVQFSRPRKLKVGRVARMVKGILFRAHRGKMLKVKNVSFTGTGIIDWRRNMIRIPDKAAVRTEAMRANFLDWPDLAGPVPKTAGPFDRHLILCILLDYDPATGVVDLKSL